MPHLQAHDSQIYYETTGSGHPLVLIPGFGCDILYFEMIKPILSPHFQLVLIDNQCTGRSECKDKPLTIDAMSKDIASVIDHLTLDKPHVLGHSMGGAIARTLAYQYPEKVGKVVLYHPLIHLSPIMAAVIRYIITLREDKAPTRYEIDAFMPWLFSNAFMEDPNKRDFLTYQKENEPFPVTLIGLKRQFEAMQKYNGQSESQKFGASALVLTGDEDLCCDPNLAKDLAKRLPNAKLYLFEKQGHSTHLEKPEEFCRVVLDFLKK